MFNLQAALPLLSPNARKNQAHTARHAHILIAFELAGSPRRTSEGPVSSLDISHFRQHSVSLV
jgi:hypothetical protein